MTPGSRSATGSAVPGLQSSPVPGSARSDDDLARAGDLDVSVVLPTYNESASLPLLVPRIVAALQQGGLRGEVIVVDDNSPDGTAEVANKLAETLPVRVLKRTEERGLGTAVLRGFDMSAAEVCVVMDADGSHPVEALPGMVKMILSDKAEIVVGSRHVPGGGSTDWPLFSRFKSRFAAILALGLTGMTDPTTGFMGLRRTLLSGLELDPIGWKIVLETVVKAYPVRLAEVPIVFIDREQGESKQSLGVLWQYFTHLYKLYKFRFPALVEFLKFCLVGVLGLFVDLSIVTALKELAGVDTRLCQVFGFVAAVSFNFVINRRFSFEHARETPLLPSYVAYVGANLVGLTVRMLVIHLLMRATSLDSGRGYLLLSVIGIVLATLINFVGVKYFAFAPSRRDEVERPSLSASSSNGVAGAESPLYSKLSWALFALSCLAFLTISSLGQLPRTHDELVNLTMAENIRAGFDGFVHPSVSPHFTGDWHREALPLLGNTPVYPLLLSAFMGLGSAGLSLLSLLTFAGFLLCIYASLSPLSRSSARVALLLAASAPWLFAQFSLYEFEPLVAAAGALGFALLMRAERHKRPGLLALAAGAALGIGFAVKMWLVVPALVACIGFLVTRVYNVASATAERAKLRRVIVCAALGFLALGSAHLLFVALVSPSDLGAWIEWVYLGLFDGRGVTGRKLNDGRDSIWAYLIWLVRDHGALLAPIVLGLPSLTRRVGAMQKAWSAATGFALLAIVPLSVPAAKEPLYLAPVLPFFYAFAGLALSSPEHTPARYARVDRAAAKLSLFVAGGLAAYWLIAALSARGAALPPAILHLAHLAVWTAPSFSVLHERPINRVILPCALASVLLAIVLTASGSYVFE